MSESREKGDVIRLDARVKEVVLMEDRAQVIREGQADLPAGRVQVRVEGVAPILADKTLAVSVVLGPSGTQVAWAKVERALTRRAESRPEVVAEMEANLEAEEEKRQILADRLEGLREELEGLADAMQKRVDEISEDAAWGRDAVKEWASHLGCIDERETVLRARRVVWGKEKDDIEEKIHDIEQRRDALLSPVSDFVASIVAELHLESSGPCTLGFRYLVPGACWRPQHRATLIPGEGTPTIRFEMDGCVWQYTGEDWMDADLAFSTQRPSLGTEPPLLRADELSAEKKEEVVAVEMRDLIIETAGLGRGKQTKEMPGIDDAGEALTLRSKHRASIPSDGRPYRVAILSFEGEARAEYLALPELAAAVIHKVACVNGANRPLLAGPVDLVAESGFVGRTSVLYVAPGEKFEIGFGPDPEIRIHRKSESKEHEKGMLSRWIRTKHTVTLHLSNIGAAKKTFRVRERIPVSEIEQVKVTCDEAGNSEGVVPDEDGFVEWKVDLPGGGTATRELRYTVEKHQDVVGM